MSRLEKAMERAKQARDSSISPVRTPSSPPKEKKRRSINPVYTQTRVCPIDAASLERQGVLTSTSYPAIVEQYNLLRARVVEAMAQKGYKALLVASPGPQEGKTITAVNLAVSITRETSRTVLLIDSDMRQPSVYRYFCLPEGPGLYEHIAEGQPLNGLLINPGLARLTVLPAGRPREYPADLMGSPAMEELVEEIKGRYPDRFIIFDSPPLLAYADGLYLARYADAVLMVVSSGKTREDDLKKALELLRDRPLLGTVFNQVPKGQVPIYYYKSYT